MWLLYFARVWVLVGHSIACAFTSAVALLYLFFAREPSVAYNLGGQVHAAIPSLIKPTLVTAVIGSIGHVVLLVRALVLIVRAIRHSRASVRPSATTEVTAFVTDQKLPGPRRVLATHSRLGRLRDKLLSFWHRHSAEITRLFILWEVALQTFQANKISQLITSHWINRVVTVVVVANCWFSPVIHYFLGTQPKTFVRLNRLLVDSCLDMAYNIGIPLTIFYPYYRDYTGGLTLFPPVLFFLDTWYSSAISELRQIFTTSWIDLASKLTAGLALQYRLYAIHRDIGVASRELAIRASQRHLPAPISPTSSRLTRALDVVLMAWGATVLSLHIHAAVTSSINHNAGCLLEMRPWGSTQYTCAALEVSCPKWHTVGDKQKVHDAIATVDPDYIQILIVSNCPALHMPSNVQLLSNLLTIKVYNSTVLEWGDDAALTGSYHASLKTLYFARAHMSVIPPGLLSHEFPETVWDIMFSLSNIPEFPDRVATAWTGVNVLAIEGNPLITTIPRGIIQLPMLTVLGLRHNNIETIADDALLDAAFIFFDLAGNPLQALPKSIGSIEYLQLLDVRSTHVREFPSTWSQMKPSMPRIPTFALAGDSPLCAVTPETSATLVSWIVVDCTPVTINSLEYGYPIQSEDMWRRATQ